MDTFGAQGSLVCPCLFSQLKKNTRMAAPQPVGMCAVQFWIFKGIKDEKMKPPQDTECS